MARYDRFTFLCNSDERRLLVALADRLQRSQSDTVRGLIREAALEFDVKGNKAATEGVTMNANPFRSDHVAVAEFGDLTRSAASCLRPVNSERLETTP